MENEILPQRSINQAVNAFEEIVFLAVVDLSLIKDVTDDDLNYENFRENEVQNHICIHIENEEVAKTVLKVVYISLENLHFKNI